MCAIPTPTLQLVTAGGYNGYRDYSTWIVDGENQQTG